MAPNVIYLTQMPLEILEEISVRVASSSIQEELSLSLTCKRLCRAGQARGVMVRANLSSLSVHLRKGIHWMGIREGKTWDLLASCSEAGNPEALLWDGVTAYFCEEWLERGRDLLQRAKGLGSVGAQFTLGLIAGIEGDEDLCWSLLSPFTGSRALRMAGSRFRCPVRAYILRLGHMFLFERLAPYFCTRWEIALPRVHWNRPGWVLSLDEEDALPCMRCWVDL